MQSGNHRQFKLQQSILFDSPQWFLTWDQSDWYPRDSKWFRWLIKGNSKLEVWSVSTYNY